MKTRITRRSSKASAAIAAMVAIVAMALSAVPVAAGVDDFPGQTELEIQQAADRSWDGIDEVRLSTGQYHDLDRAIADGFMPLALDGGDEATCIDGPGGSSGVRYVRGLDGWVDASAPEALVYELTPDGRHRLVAVEYLVPAMFVESKEGRATPPVVLGRQLQRRDRLPLYRLQVWAWKENPFGMFATVDPTLSCPNG